MQFPLRRILFFTAAAVCLVFLNGCRSSKRDYIPHLTRFYLEESSHLPPSHIEEMVLPVSRSHITVQTRPVFAEWDIANVTQINTEFGPAVMLLFRPTAAQSFYRTTVTNQGKRMVVAINGIPLGAFYISRPIEDGRIVFYLEVPDEELPEIIRSMQKTSDEIRDAQSW